jgi:hypothetical protein
VIVVDPDEARDVADEILGRPEYQEAEPPILQRVLDRIGDLLGDLIGFVSGSGGGYVIGYLILIAALVAAGYAAWRIRPRYHPLQQPAAPWLANDTTPARTRAEWLAEALAAESSSRWDRAVHARYHALVAGLADGGQLPGERSTTSGEHRLAFAHRSAGSPDRLERFERFDHATDRFEHVWFGGHPAQRADSQALADADRSLLGASG